MSSFGAFSGTARRAGALTDFQALLGALVDNRSDLQNALIVLHLRTALALSVLQSSGQYTFPLLTPVGGFVLGVPVATTVSAVHSGSPTERLCVVLDGARILIADDAEIELNASRATALEMVDNPTMDATGATQPVNVVSMFQTDSVAVKARRGVNFQRAHSSAVAWMTSTF